MADINPILQAAQVSRMQIGESALDLQDVYKNLTELNTSTQDLMTGVGEAIGLITKIQDTASLDVQRKKLEKANELGIDPTKREDILSQLSKTIANSYNERDTALQSIKAKQSVQLTDNPLEWLMNQLTINTDIRKHNIAEEQLNNASKQYANLNALSQTTNQTQDQLKQSITDASIEANQKKIALETKLKVSEKLKEGLLYNAQGIVAMMEIPSKLLNIRFQELNAVHQQEQFNLALTEEGRRREQFEWQKQEKAMQEKSDSIILDQYNKGRMMRLGADAEEIRPGTAKAKNIIDLIKSNSPVGKEFQQDYFAGESGILSATPSQALELFNTQRLRIPPVQMEVRKVLEQALKDIQNTQEYKMGMKPEVIKVNVDKRTREILDGMLKEIKIGDSNNLFNIPALATIIDKVPELQKFPIYEKLFKERILAGDTLNDPNSVFVMVGKGIKDKKITYQDALDLPAFYQRAVGINLAARNLGNFGIQPSKENSQFAYRVKVSTEPGVSASDEIVDLTKVDTFGRALNTYLSLDMMLERQKRNMTPDLTSPSSLFNPGGR